MLDKKLPITVVNHGPQFGNENWYLFHCPKCSYTLENLQADNCPECNQSIYLKKGTNK